jgi:hypothetical protein
MGEVKLKTPKLGNTKEFVKRLNKSGDALAEKINGSISKSQKGLDKFLERFQK